MQLKQGMRIVCFIRGMYVDDAIVQEENECIFICQDIMGGRVCENRHGYKCSWSVRSGDEFGQKEEGVTRVQLLRDLAGLLPAKGMRIQCKIQQTMITDAMVQEEDGLFFICQNLRGGRNCRDKLGYKYSWFIGKGHPRNLLFHEVYDLEELTESDNVVDYMQLGRKETC